MIGVFDSGIGGLSVLREIQKRLPNQATLYVADQAHVPYGPRPLEEVRSFAFGISQWLMAQGCEVIVVACNAASASALKELREAYPFMRFVGMEPAVKPAVEHTRTGKVGVLATPATFQGKLYASVVERFAGDVQLLTDTCPGLVAEIEAGRLDDIETRRILTDALHPMLSAGIDTIVLGCTHYPFVIPLIEDIVGKDVRVIDPAPAVARQVERLVGVGSGKNQPDSRYATTGDPHQFQAQLMQLLGIDAHVEMLTWRDNTLDV